MLFGLISTPTASGCNTPRTSCGSRNTPNSISAAIAANLSPLKWRSSPGRFGGTILPEMMSSPGQPLSQTWSYFSDDEDTFAHAGHHLIPINSVKEGSHVTDRMLPSLDYDILLSSCAVQNDGASKEGAGDARIELPPLSACGGPPQGAPSKLCPSQLILAKKGAGEDVFIEFVYPESGTRGCLILSELLVFELGAEEEMIPSSSHQKPESPLHKTLPDANIARNIASKGSTPLKQMQDRIKQGSDFRSRSPTKPKFKNLFKAVRFPQTKSSPVSLVEDDSSSTADRAWGVVHARKSRLEKKVLNFPNLNAAVIRAVPEIATIIGTREEGQPFDIMLSDVGKFVRHMAEAFFGNEIEITPQEVEVKVLHVLRAMKLLPSLEDSKPEKVGPRTAKKDNITYAFKNALINAGITYSGYQYSGGQIVKAKTGNDCLANRTKNNQSGAGANWRSNLWTVQNKRPKLWTPQISAKVTGGKVKAPSNTAAARPPVDHCDRLFNIPGSQPMLPPKPRMSPPKMMVSSPLKETPSEPVTVDDNPSPGRPGISSTSDGIQPPMDSDKRLLITMMEPESMLPPKMLPPKTILPRLGIQSADTADLNGLLVIPQESTSTTTHLQTKIPSACPSPPKIVFAPAPSNTQPSITQPPKQDAKPDQKPAGKALPISDSAPKHLMKTHVPTRQVAQPKPLSKKRKAEYIAVQNFSPQKKALHKLAMEAITGSKKGTSAPIRITVRGKIPPANMLDQLAEIASGEYMRSKREAARDAARKLKQMGDK